MIQGALFGQDDEDDEYLEPNDSESSNDKSELSFEPVESVDEDVTSESDESDATAATQQVEAVEALEEVVVAAATETVESTKLGVSDSSATDDSFDTNLLQATSAPFVGAWQTLVSQTNWEKGKIILDWREALVAADAPVHEYSDEAWATLVELISKSLWIGPMRKCGSRALSKKSGLFPACVKIVGKRLGRQPVTSRKKATSFMLN